MLVLLVVPTASSAATAHVVVALVCGLLAAAPASALAEDPPSLLGINSERGRIDLALLAPTRSKVDFFERVGGQSVPIGTAAADSV